MKGIAIIFLALLSLTLLFLGVTLVPAHLQIRAINAAIPPIEDVTNLRLSGADRPQAVTFIVAAQQASKLGNSGYVGILVTWADGTRLLIDTGMDAASAREFGKPIELILGAAPTETFGALEAQLQDEVNNISGIVFTHLHSDHTQGLTALCNAMVKPARIFQTSTQSNKHNYTTKAGQTLIDEASCQKLVLEGEAIIPIDGFPGVYAIAAAGHTPGSTVYVVVTGKQTWIFSGDLSNDIGSIHNNAGKGWLYSYFIVPENTALLEAWRVWLRALDGKENVSVLPAHDIDLMREKLKVWK